MCLSLKVDIPPHKTFDIHILEDVSNNSVLIDIVITL